MEPATGNEVLFSSFIAATCVYWIYFKLTEAFIRHFFPDFYRINNVDRAGNLLSAVIMIIRGTWGFFVTFPTCIMAARTTPWERGQDLNAWGKVCMASQCVTWAGEMHLQNETDVPLFFHHICCLLVLANTAMFPKIHTIKAAYIFVTSQVGDVTFSVGKVMRKSGLTPRNSWSCWACTIGSAIVSILSKCPNVLWIAAHAFESPRRGVDWLWGFCLHFFAAYTLSGACYSLNSIGLFNHAMDGSRELIVMKRWRVSQFNVFLCLAGLVTIWLRTNGYIYLQPQRVDRYDIAKLWAKSFVFVAFIFPYAIKACTNATCRVVDYQGDIQKGELYLRFAAMAATAYMLAFWPGGAGANISPDEPKILAFTIMVLPVWDGIVRMAICVTARSTGQASTAKTDGAKTKQGDGKAQGLMGRGSKHPDDSTQSQPGSQSTNTDLTEAIEVEQKAMGHLHTRRILEKVFLLTYIYCQRRRHGLVEASLILLGASTLTSNIEDTLHACFSSSPRLTRKQRFSNVTLSHIQIGLVLTAQYGFTSSSLPFGAMVVTSLGTGCIANLLGRVLLGLCSATSRKGKRQPTVSTEARGDGKKTRKRSWLRTLINPYVWCTIVAVVTQGYALKLGLQPEPYDGTASTSIHFVNLMQSMGTPMSILIEIAIFMAMFQTIWLSVGGIKYSR